MRGSDTGLGGGRAEGCRFCPGAAPPGHLDPSFPRPPSSAGSDHTAFLAEETERETETSLNFSSQSELTGSWKGKNPDTNQSTANEVRDATRSSNSPFCDINTTNTERICSLHLGRNLPRCRIDRTFSLTHCLYFF